MNSKLPATLRIGLSGRSVALVRSRGWLHPRHELLTELPLGAAGAQDALQGLSTALASTQSTRMRATVVLGNDLVRLFMVKPPRNAERLRDCQAAAMQRFQQLYGEPATAWSLRGDWDARLPFLACAMPQDLLHGLRKTAIEHRLALVAVQPHFVAAWNRWRHAVPERAWYGVADAGRLTLGILDRARLIEVRCLDLPPGARQDSAWLSVQVSREALRQALPAPECICLCGRVPQAWRALPVGAPACVPFAPPMALATEGAELASAGARS